MEEGINHSSSEPIGDGEERWEEWRRATIVCVRVDRHGAED